MLSTIMIVLAIWLGLNAAFVAIRFYIAADQAGHAEDDFVRESSINAAQLDR